MNCFKVIMVLVLSTFSVHGQELVTFESADFRQIKDNQSMDIKLYFKVKEGFYIQSESPKSENLIATKIEIETLNSYQVLDTVFSNGIAKNQQGFIKDTFSVVLRLKKLEESSDIPKMRVVLAYQACSQKQCFYPRNLEFQIP